ncbi:MAG: tRNA uridine-5-carboxymethylaminomethyl(34) synthesis GTPase MnmE [Pyrinomonadaceae bacterium]
MSDTIVALATPVGRSGIGVIRLSGPQSLLIIRQLIKKNNFNPAPRYAQLKKIHDIETGEILDEAIIVYFQTPNSFTGEDVFEISCHGSPVILRQIIDFCLKLDARLAEPGEFSLRALANGRINLSQAEAIRDLIESQTLSAVKQSVRQLQGEISNQLQPIKDNLLEVIVILESSIEFVEDDLPDIQIEKIVNKLSAVSDEISEFALTYQSGKLLREGLSVAIVGRPNVGKSSLFNALLGQDRAIVTDIAGTTRDQINEKISINGIPISLIDTAGLRDTVDIVESIGVERSKRTMADADMVVVLLDGSQNLTSEDLHLLSEVKQLNHLIAINKIDLQLSNQNLGYLKTFKISAKTGEGLQNLQNGIVEPFMENQVSNAGFLISDARHYDLLLRSNSEIENSISSLHQKMSEEITLVNLYNALTYIGQITGETTNEEMLTKIFSTFCIGK